MRNAEQLAKEYVSKHYNNFIEESFSDEIKDCFIAGYNKAKEWISVEDSLPELPDKITDYRQNRFLVKYDTGGADISSFNKNKKTFAVESARARPKRKVTHWKYID